MADESPLLDALDEVLADIRRAPQRQVYRARLLGDVHVAGGLAAVRVLRVAARHHSTMPTIGVIAEALAIDPSTASRTVDKCVSAGFLDRRTDQVDRRRAGVRLTESGRAVLDELTQNRRRVLREITREWPEADLELLVELLDRLRDDFDRLEVGE